MAHHSRDAQFKRRAEIGQPARSTSSRVNEGKNLSRFDVVFETVGKLPFTDSLKLVKPQGTIIAGSEMPGQMLQRMFSGKGGKQAHGRLR